MINDLAHVLAGFLTTWGILIDPNITLIGFLGFELYENLQHLKEDDWAVSETLEFMVGFYLGVVTVLICDFLWLKRLV